MTHTRINNILPIVVIQPQKKRKKKKASIAVKLVFKTEYLFLLKKKKKTEYLLYTPNTCIFNIPTQNYFSVGETEIRCPTSRFRIYTGLAVVRTLVFCIIILVSALKIWIISIPSQTLYLPRLSLSLQIRTSVYFTPKQSPLKYIKFSLSPSLISHNS